ncbi:hypothetical protein KR009_011887 [Drosophila setifemur]|nr:hypothetical protein KR009_011887 [Drosophila setifemur]
MQRHKELYKEQSLVLSPRNHSQTNRDIQRAARAKQREDVFHSNRIISVSPTPMKSKQNHSLNRPSPSQIPEAKENQLPNQQQEEFQPKLSREKIESPMQGEKKTRQQLYLQRFLKWKTARKEERKLQELAHRGQAPLETKQTTEFPQADTFSMPENLRPESAVVEQQNASVFVPPKKRSSLYVIVNPTGKVKSHRTNAETTDAVSRVPPKPRCPEQKARTTIPRPQPVKTRSAPSNLRTQMDNVRQKQPVAASFVPKTMTTIPKSTPLHRPKPTPLRTQQPPTLRSQQPPMLRSKPPPTLRQQTPAMRPKATPSSALRAGPFASIQAPKLPNLRTQPFEKPPTIGVPEGRKPNIVKPQPVRGGGGAVGKFKNATGAFSKAVNKSTRMKPTTAKSTAKMQQKARNLLRAELLEAATVELPPGTPLEEHPSENPFITQNTSTQTKSNNCSANLQEAFSGIPDLSPVAPNPVNSAGEASAKRQLLPGCRTQDEPEKKPPGPKKKYDFTRYSVVNSPAEDSLVLDPQQPAIENEQVSSSTLIRADSEEKTLVPTVEKTPPRRESLPNYLSPFVSVSRGKVNSRSEREKRNSMYLPEEEMPVHVRRAIESVLYFRLQLENEINRLNALCSEWEAYSGENEARLQETGGLDMINVTIGQTRLLTTKKMVQFSGLIDRCEAGATGKNQRPNDGSEATKPVQAEDLEGWWDMLRLQSDNVDKRFDNLKRWRANDWQDPDAVAEEERKKLAKPRAKLGLNMKLVSKAKPSSSLQQFLRKAHAAKKQVRKEEQEPGVVPLPATPERRNSRVVVVRDRRSFSPARTVIRMSIGEGRPSIAPNALLKSALIAAAEQNAANQTPPPRTRASILKTPGTTKRQSQGVMFSAKKSVRRFVFTYEEGSIGAEGADKLEDCEEDMSLEERRSMERAAGGEPSGGENGVEGTPRAYTLRNRRVHLRPSSEFM